jgi:beta-galactosidase
MSTVTGINKSAIKEIRIGEWNPGTYYIDDAYFAQNASDAVPAF